MAEIKQPGRLQGSMGAGGYPRDSTRRDGSTRQGLGDHDGGTGEGHNISDKASILGIPLKNVTPQVQEAITKLMQEVESLRGELARSHEREQYLKSLADQDPLLPINNRRFFMREIKRILSHSERTGAPSSLVYLEVLNSEEIKTHHGHAAREGALIQASLILKSELRASDVIGNLGAAGIGIILAIADQNGANQKLKSFRAAFRERPFIWIGETIYLDVDMVTRALMPGDNGEQVLRAMESKILERKTGEAPI